jgi:DNA-binding transcriptional LysR family regulator
MLSFWSIIKIIDSQGVTFLPVSYVRPRVEAGDLVYLNIAGLPALMSQPVLIARADRKLDDMHTAFTDILKSRWRHLLVG